MEQLIENSFVSALFLIIGFLLLFLEIFIPTGGILGILSIASTLFGVYGFYSQDRTLVAALSLGGFAVYGFFVLRFILRRVRFDTSQSPESYTSVDERITDSLVGQTGRTITPLRPAGMAVVKDRKVDVVSSGGFLEKDVPVKIIDISGNRVVVREWNQEGKQS